MAWRVGGQRPAFVVQYAAFNGERDFHDLDAPRRYLIAAGSDIVTPSQVLDQPAPQHLHCARV